MNALSFQHLAIRYRQQKERPALPDFFRLLPSLTLTVFLLLAPKNWINATVKRAREQENELKRIYTIRLLSRRKMEKTENVVVTREGLWPFCEGRRQKSLPLSSSFQSCL